MITFVTVVYNTKELLEKSYCSLKKFYPDIKHLIIDGSDMTDECYWYADGLDERVFHAHRNIGHGSGMHLAMELVDTKYVCFYDSDIEMVKPCIDEMLSCFNDDTYGVGSLVRRSAMGLFEPCRDEGGVAIIVNLLHPYFCIINKDLYKNYAPIVSCGSPFIMIWADMFRRKLDKKVIIDFPVEDYVNHLKEGTRDIVPNDWHRLQGHINWELSWEFFKKNRREN